MFRQNKFIKSISPTVRLIILILLILCLIIAKSIYLILLINTIALLICLLTSEKVNTYVKFIKKAALILSIFLIIYIIIFKEYNGFQIVFMVYKMIVIMLMIKTFDINTDFSEMHEAIYGLCFPFKKLDIERFSFDITLSLNFIKFWFDSSEQIRKIQTMNGRRSFSLKNFVVPRLIWTIKSLNKLQLLLNLNFYDLKYRRWNLKSKFMLLLFLLFFIVCIFKEVIL